MRAQVDGVGLRLHVVDGEGVELAVWRFAGGGHADGMRVIIDGADMLDLGEQFGVGGGLGRARTGGEEDCREK